MNKFFILLVSYFLLGSVTTVPANSNELRQSTSIDSQIEFLNGSWEGTYICRQGLTNLRLVIDARSTTEIDAVFIT